MRFAAFWTPLVYVYFRFKYGLVYKHTTTRVVKFPCVRMRQTRTKRVDALWCVKRVLVLDTLWCVKLFLCA